MWGHRSHGSPIVNGSLHAHLPDVIGRLVKQQGKIKMTNRTASTFENRVRISEFVGLDGLPTCRVVRAGAEFAAKQGHLLASGISAQSAGASKIHLQIATIPPGTWAKAHMHADHETALYVLSGESGMWYGKTLEQHLTVPAGDFLYIPANMPHLPYNPSESENCVAVIARTDPAEQESVVLLPGLDAVHETRCAMNTTLPR
jgi:uncharacterized RmlC-like cupin family protein